MAKIPTVGPGGTQLVNPKLTTQSPSALQIQPIGQGRGISILGQDIEKSASFLYQKMDEARNFTEIAQAEAADARMLAGELAKAETAVDKIGRPRQGGPEDFKDHDETFKQSEETIGGFFSNKAVEARYKSERQKNIIATRNQIARKYQQNMIDGGKAAVMDSTAKNIANYANAPDKSKGSMVMAGWVPDKPFYEYRIKEDIKEAVKMGFLTQTQAQKLRDDSLREAKKNSFLFDLANNFKVVEENLKTNSYGLDIAQLKDAKSIFDIEKGRIQNTHEEELDQLAYDNKLDYSLIDVYVENKWIDAKSGKTRKESLDKTLADNPDPFVYNSMLERAAEISKIGGWWKNAEEKKEMFKQAATLRVDIFKEVGKNLTKKEAGEILKKMGGSFDNFEPYRSGIVQLKSFADMNYSPAKRDKIKQELYQKFMGLVEKGMNPIEAIEKAKNRYDKYNMTDLEFTAKETGLSIEKIVEILDNKEKGIK